MTFSTHLLIEKLPGGCGWRDVELKSSVLSSPHEVPFLECVHFFIGGCSSLHKSITLVGSPSRIHRREGRRVATCRRSIPSLVSATIVHSTDPGSRARIHSSIDAIAEERSGSGMRGRGCTLPCPVKYTPASFFWRSGKSLTHISTTHERRSFKCCATQSALGYDDQERPSTRHPPTEASLLYRNGSPCSHGDDESRRSSEKRSD